MELRRTEQGFALYKEKDCIGTCAVRPAAKGADITALCIAPQWRRRGYGSYLLKEVLRTFAGYDREKATVFSAPLPADPGERAFWAKFGFAAEGGRLYRRRTPDLTAVKFVQEKKLISSYFDELARDTGKYCFGVNDTLRVRRGEGR